MVEAYSELRAEVSQRKQTQSPEIILSQLINADLPKIPVSFARRMTRLLSVSERN
jgi:hypothetical protein